MNLFPFVTLALFSAIEVYAQGDITTSDSVSATPSGTASSAAVSPIQTAGLSSCALNCITFAFSNNGCAGLTDTACICANTDEQTSANDCLNTQCSTGDVIAVQGRLQLAGCSAVAISATGSVTSAVDSPSSAESVSVSSLSTSKPATLPTSTKISVRPSTTSKINTAVTSAERTVASSGVTATTGAVGANGTAANNGAVNHRPFGFMYFTSSTAVAVVVGSVAFGLVFL
ncbi:hypothetical protein D9757_014819 [Collybiopsis confluens]|uniref:CFEM domain-containing protein n=1 Tax=Collybiopsis confluens TaxID=2823264 RepID=A0A8H5G8A6_9AGAR|nr:hypothetical protein D9757_014819 [Collybiopsis confluens]